MPAEDRENYRCDLNNQQSLLRNKFSGKSIRMAFCHGRACGPLVVDTDTFGVKRSNAFYSVYSNFKEKDCTVCKSNL